MSRFSVVPLFQPWHAPQGHRWDALETPLRLFDQHFGRLLDEDDLISIPASLMAMAAGYCPRAKHQADRQKSGLSEVECKKDQFRVRLDVQHFAPEELEVKMVDNFVVVEGKHEEKQDQHGFVSRQFVRRYAIPDDAEVEKLQSNLSSDGVLTIVAPRKMPQLADKSGRSIPITFTGQPATAQVDPRKEDAKADSQEVGQHQQ